MDADLATVVQFIVVHAVVLGVALVTLVTLIGLCISEQKQGRFAWKPEFPKQAGPKTTSGSRRGAAAALIDP
jgi:hypothetical protein